MNKTNIIKSSWGNSPIIAVLHHGSCCDLAIIPLFKKDEINKIKREFLNGSTYEYINKNYGSGSINYHFVGEDFINYLNRKYFTKTDAKAIFIMCRDKFSDNVFKNAPFENIYF